LKAVEFMEIAMTMQLNFYQIVELATGGSECIFDCNFNMFVPAGIRRRVIDYDIFVRWNCYRDVDMEAAAVAVLMARCDHSHAASNDVMIVLFQPVYFTLNRNAHGLRRLGSFKSQLQRNLHNDLSGP
jgi:hypothetical protein